MLPSWLLNRLERVSQSTLLGLVGLTIAMLAASGLAHIRGSVNVSIIGSIILLICLLILSAIDLETGLLPNWLTLPLIGLGLVQNWASGNVMWPFVAGGLAGYLLILALSTYWLQFRGERGMGLGDAKLLAASGTWLGAYALPGVLLAASAAGLVTVIAWSLISKTSLNPRKAIPFGPFLAFGTWTIWCNTSV